MRQAFTGCGTALVTPFTSSGGLDEAGVRRLARRQIDAGIHFLVPCGTTGETPTLTPDERRRVVEIVVAESKGQVPVLAGAGGYNTHEVIEAAQHLARAGADGILSVAPYYNKPTPEGLFQHYKAIADAVPLPIIVYNVPGTHRRQRGRRHDRAPERGRRTSSASRKRRATSRRCARSAGRSRTTSWCCRATMR